MYCFHIFFSFAIFFTLVNGMAVPESSNLVAENKAETVDKQPELVDKQPELVDKQPETVDKQPEVVDKQPEVVEKPLVPPVVNVKEEKILPIKTVSQYFDDSKKEPANNVSVEKPVEKSVPKNLSGIKEVRSNDHVSVDSVPNVPSIQPVHKESKEGANISPKPLYSFPGQTEPNFKVLRAPQIVHVSPGNFEDVQPDESIPNASPPLKPSQVNQVNQSPPVQQAPSVQQVEHGQVSHQEKLPQKSIGVKEGRANVQQRYKPQQVQHAPQQVQHAPQQQVQRAPQQQVQHAPQQQVQHAPQQQVQHAPQQVQHAPQQQVQHAPQQQVQNAPQQAQPVPQQQVQHVPQQQVQHAPQKPVQLVSQSVQEAPKQEDENASYQQSLESPKLPESQKKKQDGIKDGHNSDETELSHASIVEEAPVENVKKEGIKGARSAGKETSESQLFQTDKQKVDERKNFKSEDNKQKIANNHNQNSHFHQISKPSSKDKPSIKEKASLMKENFSNIKDTRKPKNAELPEDLKVHPKLRLIASVQAEESKPVVVQEPNVVPKEIVDDRLKVAEDKVKVEVVEEPKLSQEQPQQVQPEKSQTKEKFQELLQDLELKIKSVEKDIKGVSMSQKAEILREQFDKLNSIVNDLRQKLVEEEYSALSEHLFTSTQTKFNQISKNIQDILEETNSYTAKLDQEIKKLDVYIEIPKQSDDKLIIEKLSPPELPPLN